MSVRNRKKTLKKSLQVALVAGSLIMRAGMAEAFVVKHIKVQGNHRISYGTVLNYLPVHVGQDISEEDTADIIRALYKTGFFTNVDVARRGNTLIVHVQERPTIEKISISGNKEITTENLKTVLKNVGIAEGRVFDRSTLDNVQSSLQNQYYDRGNYNAQVTTKVVNESQNRVKISIEISEGSSAKIHEIKIIGNHAFSEKKLRGQFKLSTSHVWSFLTKSDQYSREKLDGDLEALRSFYMDNGYINFKIDSTQVSITPDKKDVYIVIHVTEGDQYRFKGFKLSGKLIYPRKDLRKLVEIKPGETFSRKKVNAGSKAIGNYLGNDGYTFAKVRPIPEVDDKNKTVMVTYVVEPGKQVYVRRINFTGNTKTADYVLRREMRQQEGGLASLKDIQESEHRLNMLSYFKNVAVKTNKVPGVDDQVDLDFSVVEAPSASLTLGVGYSDDDGFLINAGFNQPNFLGTGKSLGINANTSDYERSASVSYFNPYYTKDGIGRGYTAYFNTTDSDKVDISTYATDTVGISSSYYMPLSETDSLSFGYGYQMERIETDKSDRSVEINKFITDYGDKTNNVMLNAGWSHIGFDRAIFPTRGFAQSIGLNVAVPGGGSEDLSYYKINYLAHFYQPLTHGFILSLRGELGYGGGFGRTSELPFYQNYFAGGIGTQGAVRGYNAYSIGPQDSNGDTIGGNALVDGSVELVIPTGITPDTFRTVAFIDFGNVYTNVNTTIGSGPMRYSAGVAAHWRSPIGPLIFSLAAPLNRQPQDEREPMQFTVGTSF